MTSSLPLPLLLTTRRIDRGAWLHRVASSARDTEDDPPSASARFYDDANLAWIHTENVTERRRRLLRYRLLRPITLLLLNEDNRTPSMAWLTNRQIDGYIRDHRITLLRPDACLSKPRGMRPKSSTSPIQDPVRIIRSLARGDVLVKMFTKDAGPRWQISSTGIVCAPDAVACLRHIGRIAPAGDHLFIDDPDSAQSWLLAPSPETSR